MRDLLKHLQAIALLRGASLTSRASLRPVHIDLNAKHGDYSRGVLAMVVEVYTLICQTPDGRQAILDLGFQPVFEKVDGGLE